MIALVTEDGADRIWRELPTGIKTPEGRARVAIATAIGRRPIPGTEPPVFRLHAGGKVEKAIRAAAERAGVAIVLESRTYA